MCLCGVARGMQDEECARRRAGEIRRYGGEDLVFESECGEGKVAGCS